MGNKNIAELYGPFHFVRRNYVERKQARLIENIVKSDTLQEALETSQVSLRAARRWFSNKDFLEQLSQFSKWHKKGLLLTDTYIKAMLYDGISGDVQITKEQMKLLEISSRMFNMDRRAGYNPFESADSFKLEAQKGTAQLQVSKATPAVIEHSAAR